MYIRIYIHNPGHPILSKAQVTLKIMLNGRVFVWYADFMKLYLSSYFIPDQKEFLKFIGADKGKTKIAFILNAADHKSEGDREEKVKYLTSSFLEMGLLPQEINLKDYFGKQEDLNSLVDQFDVVWVAGGNTFCLMWAINKSGFDIVIKKKKIVYAGDSAGGIVAGPTLRFYDRADNPEFAPEVFWKGMNLTDTAILPHYDSENFHEAVVYVEKNLEKEGIKTIRLKDGEVFLVNE
jgi:dipeptidase E